MNILCAKMKHYVDVHSWVSSLSHQEPLKNSLHIDTLSSIYISQNVLLSTDASGDKKKPIHLIVGSILKFRPVIIDGLLRSLPFSKPLNALLF